MTRTGYTINALALFVFALTLTAPARADAARTFVHSGGDDAAPCTQAQPCRTFDAALTKTDAGGEVVALDSGTYDPAFIRKSVTIAAAPGAEPVIRAQGGVSALVVEAAASDEVTLKGLKLAGPGADTAGSYGVAFRLGGELHVEGCLINGFDRGVNAEPGGFNLYVSDTTLRGNNYGLYVRSHGVLRGPR